MRPLPGLHVALPDWVGAYLPDHPLPDVEQRMRLVLALAQANIEHGTGGPFAAAVFDAAHRLIAPGVNLVTHLNCSAAHAEIIALSLAQHLRQDWRLNDCELVASAEPCAMCLGALPWAGIRRLVCSATDRDVRATGFDEGAKPPDWQSELRLRGIEVRTGYLQEEGRRILHQYVEMGGIIYNGRPSRAQ